MNAERARCPGKRLRLPWGQVRGQQDQYLEAAQQLGGPQQHIGNDKHAQVGGVEPVAGPGPVSADLQ